MTNNTTSKTDEHRPEPGNEAEPRSIIARVGKWLKPSRAKAEDREDQSEAPSGPSQVEPQAADQRQTEASAGSPDPGTPEEGKPRRPPRKRSGRRRSRAVKPEGTEVTASEAVVAEEAGETEAPPVEAEAVGAVSPEEPPSGKKKARSRSPRSRKKTEAEKAEKPGTPEKDEKTEEPKTGTKAPAKTGATLKLLINADEPEECRIALLENGRVESFYVETVSQAQTKGNIYKGRITAVEANLQAAFVDYGEEKNGFLPFAEIHPEYYSEEVAPGTHWKDVRVQDLISKGQELLVEVVKEVSGSKGASLTTFLSLPGRYLVLMPGSDSAGISRKIESEAERNKLREMINSINIPEGIGYIVRTASREITKTALTQDVRFLLNLWEEIKKKGQTEKAPAPLHREQNIVSRFLRDHFTSEIGEILVDNEDALRQVQDFLDLLPAAQRKATAARLHRGQQPIFHQYHVEKQIEQVFQPTVALPSGGSIVINPTEALVAIDVNSGRTGKDKNFEDAIFLANMEAAEELTRQLRLRDLGGLIVVDFIDMRDAKHIREVEKKVRDCMKRDKAKVDFSKISKFGLMQISRQKMAAPIAVGSYRTCPHCAGRGMIRSVETQALAYLRQIQTGLGRKDIRRVLCRLPMEVAQYLQNKKRQDMLDLEQEQQIELTIIADPFMAPIDSKIEFLKE